VGLGVTSGTVLPTMSAPMTRSTPMSGSDIHARSPPVEAGDGGPAMQRASLCASGRTRPARKDTGRDGFGDGIRLARAARGVLAVAARRIAGRMLREDRDGTASSSSRGPSPGRGNHSLELPRETSRNPPGRTRASSRGPARDGADDAAQVDLVSATP